MSIDNLTFCWNGLITTNPEQTLAFFPQVLGWTVEHVSMGDDTVPMLASKGVPVAHVRPPGEGESHSWWNNYLRVEDVDATATAVQAAGGRVIVPPTDIVPGRFATVATPSGAIFTLFREPNESTRADGQGELHWVDLHSSDIDADIAFLTTALGISTQEMKMPTGAYHLLNPDGATQAGAMQQMNAGAPSMWLAWVAVDDTDAALERVSKHGGSVLAPAWDAEGIGRMAIASDPAGVVFGVITPPAA